MIAYGLVMTIWLVATVVAILGGCLLESQSKALQLVGGAVNTLYFWIVGMTGILLVAITEYLDLW